VYCTEREIGQALRQTGVSRDDIFLTTKTLNLDDVEGALEQSLVQLQTPHVDLYVLLAIIFSMS
jgi:diketogulonate reductase-like aldo/keto reductase